METYQVIILGAGVAGLTAASELIQNGVENILVLEAQNRIGGRIHTIDTFDEKCRIELGAQWLHGQKNNPVFELCSKLGLVDKQTKTIMSEQIYYYTQDCLRIDDKDEFDPIFNQIEEIFDNSEKYDEDVDQSIGAYTQLKLEKYINKLNSKHGGLTPDKIEIIKAIYNDRCKEEQAVNGAFSLNEASLLGSNEFEDFTGDFLTNLKNGYCELLDYFASKIPKDKIRLNHVVKKIQYSSLTGTPTTVTVFDKASRNETILYCDQLLCTISLGCLKDQHKDLFEPNLPQSKISSIEKIGFGIVNKMFIFFDKPVLKNRDQGINILWRDDIEFNLESVDKWNLENKTFYKSFISFEVHPKYPNLFYTFITGDDATYIETLSQECLLDVIKELFKKCFSKLHLPEPKYLIRSQWSQNPYTRGSYSYFKMGSTIDNMNVLADPLVSHSLLEYCQHKLDLIIYCNFKKYSKIHFAGEATMYKYHGTVHSAYASGLRSSKNISKLLQSKC